MFGVLSVETCSKYQWALSLLCHWKVPSFDSEEFEVQAVNNAMELWNNESKTQQLRSDKANAQANETRTYKPTHNGQATTFQRIEDNEELLQGGI